jgi:hypothetical protein
LGLYRTHSFCGTHEYLAPELLLNQGHGPPVDWWCLGVCLHEMAARRHPFKSATGQQLETLRNICALPPHMGRDLSAPAQSIITRLLAKDPDARLCGLRLLQADPFFHGLDWHGLYHRRVPAPYVPSLRSAEDTACFPACYTEARVPFSEARGLMMGGGGGEGGGEGEEEGKGKGRSCLFPAFAFPSFACQAWGAGGWGRQGRRRRRRREGEEEEGVGGAEEEEQEEAARRQRAVLAALPDEEEACFAGFDFCMPLEEEEEKEEEGVCVSDVN